MRTLTTRRSAVPSLALALALALAVAAIAALTTTGAEADHEPIHAQVLTTGGHNTFTDDVAIQVRDKPVRRSTAVVNHRDASNIAVGRFTVQPGAWFPWHTHPGTGLVAVVEGELTFIYADDCVERHYDEGEAFVDPGILHTAYNSGDTETVVIATFVGVPAGAPLATPIGDTGQAQALNEKCGTQSPLPQAASTSHGH